MSSYKQLKIFRLSFPEIRLSTRAGHKLRGFVARLFPEHDEFHNHGKTGWLYRYPLIQYKVIEGTPYIIGINQGAEKLEEMEDELNELILDGSQIPIYEKALTIANEPFGILDDVVEYAFITPWMALNQRNYGQYQVSSGVEQREILRAVLTGNLLSLSKGLGYRVESKIVVDIGKIKSIETNFKEQRMIAFLGSFFVNFAIPDYLGIGKSVSRGFGTICRCLCCNH
ncbi:CRISPR-associated endonuclease Cas6 [Bacillota bacterium LX-D]|nr:CRISPR-associated endonuclease Cas6 [Bacillota bacterium LX-D]